MFREPGRVKVDYEFQDLQLPRGEAASWVRTASHAAQLLLVSSIELTVLFHSAFRILYSLESCMKKSRHGFDVRKMNFAGFSKPRLWSMLTGDSD